MRREHLVDLDELVLLCQSAGARSGVAEAVACYRTGAFRSCIVATWMAVVWDYLDKLRALDATGDAQAKAAFKEWENAWQTDNKPKLLELERNVLEQASQDFELLSPHERRDLERLFNDRNQCAHPSLSRPDEIFEPTAELARLHLRCAVEHFMQHPPVQGRAAHDRVLTDVEGNYFPTSAEQAQRFLENGPLARPRASLVKGVFEVLVKDVLVENFDDPRRSRTFAALQAIQAMHGAIVDAWWRDKLGVQLRRVEDATLWRGVELLSVFPETWDVWPDDCRSRWQLYVGSLPAKDVGRTLPRALECAPLRDSALDGMTRYDTDVLGEVLSHERKNPDWIPDILLERALEAYEESKSFNTAITWATRLKPYAARLSAERIQRLVSTLAGNYQVRQSVAFPDFLLALRETKALPSDEFDSLCNDHELKSFVRHWNPEAEVETNEAEDVKDIAL